MLLHCESSELGYNWSALINIYTYTFSSTIDTINAETIVVFSRGGTFSLIDIPCLPKSLLFGLESLHFKSDLAFPLILCGCSLLGEEL